MKVFLSWSGERSRVVAEQLRRWIPCVIQTIEPWMSQLDIGAGMRWESEIGRHLSETKFGIICLTKGNIDAPWILFEAGALAKTVDETYVCPYLLDLGPEDIPAGPLSQFQAKRVDEEGTRDLVYTLNKALEEKGLPEPRLQETFSVWWPRLKEGLDTLPPDPALPAERRSERDMLVEVLGIVRDLSRYFGPWLESKATVAAFLDSIQRTPEYYAAMKTMLGTTDLDKFLSRISLTPSTLPSQREAGTISGHFEGAHPRDPISSEHTGIASGRDPD